MTIQIRAQEASEVRPVDPGDVVTIVDEHYFAHQALVTAVHGGFSESYVPCINVVYVTADVAKRDPYGQQVERLSSLQHYSQGPSQMTRPGRYWINA